MDKNTILTLSYAMVTAYRIKKTMGEAVEWVVCAYRDADREILEVMWATIDAYVDINGEQGMV